MRAKAKVGTAAALAKLPKVTGGNGSVYLSPAARPSVHRSGRGGQEGRRQLRNRRTPAPGTAIESSAATASILSKAGVTPTKLNQVINEIRKGRTADSANAEQGFDSLKEICARSDRRAREGKLDPVIGRDDEIRRTIQVLFAPDEEKSRADRRAGRSARPRSRKA